LRMFLRYFLVRRWYLCVQATGKVYWLVFLFSLLFCASTPVFASVAVKQLHFEWTYNLNQPGLAGYNIYLDGRRLFKINNGRTLNLDLNVALNVEQPNKFTITAFDTTGNESLPSAPYSIDLRGQIIGSLNAAYLLLLDDKDLL
jgi:hypothetical protein